MKPIIHQRRSARRTCRRTLRPLNHRTTTATAGTRPYRAPNYLALALFALRTAVRSHRRLMKLAPDRYDRGVIAHAERERAAEAARLARINAELAAIYGTSLQPPAGLPVPLPPERPPRLSRRLEKVIALEVERWETALKVGNECLDLVREKNQWSRVGVGSICSLLLLASDLGRLSTGMETNYRPPPPEPEPEWSYEAALKKIYGSPLPAETNSDPVIPATQMSGGAK